MCTDAVDSASPAQAIRTVGVLRTLPMLQSLPQPLMPQHNLWLPQYVLFRRDATKV